jgi:hypothetical protein
LVIFGRSWSARLNNLFDVVTYTWSDRATAYLGYQKWANAEQALLVYLPDNRVNTLEVNLGRGAPAKIPGKNDQIDL